MKHKSLALIIVAVITIFITYGYVEGKKHENKQVAQESQAGVQMDRDQIKDVVREYIMENPQVIIESVEKMQMDKMKQADEKRGATIQENKTALLENPMDPKAGNLKGKSYIVEFFDYSCGYCKRMLSVKEKILKEHKDVKIIFKELPVLGEFSETAAKYSLAVNKTQPDKYMSFHTEMLKYNGPRTTEAIESVIEKVGLDKEKIAQAMKDPSIQKALSDNRELAMSLGVMGSPAYIINDTFNPGAMDYNEMVAQLKK